MFLANSVIKIVPVNKIDNKKFIIKDNTRALIDLFTKKSNERKSINLEII
jgi:branched-subunit amino acid aminotransferase/4-amino-4-deoxychorismate lyase